MRLNKRHNSLQLSKRSDKVEVQRLLKETPNGKYINKILKTDESKVSLLNANPVKEFETIYKNT